MTTAYPLAWPPGRPRTPAHERRESRFRSSFATSRALIIDELDRLKARHAVLSTNIELRIDGLPRANAPNPIDPGAAVYFELKGRPLCMACDRWRTVGDNIHAIAKTIEALRGIERWGSGDMLQQAFSGFAAIAAPKTWREKLGLGAGDGLDAAEAAFRRLAKERHPDVGGDRLAFTEISEAIADARRELGR